MFITIFIDCQLICQVIFYRGAKVLQWRKHSLFTDGDGTTGYEYVQRLTDPFLKSVTKLTPTAIHIYVFFPSKKFKFKNVQTVVLRGKYLGNKGTMTCKSELIILSQECG